MISRPTVVEIAEKKRALKEVVTETCLPLVSLSVLLCPALPLVRNTIQQVAVFLLSVPPCCFCCCYREGYVCNPILFIAMNASSVFAFTFLLRKIIVIDNNNNCLHSDKCVPKDGYNLLEESYL